MENRGQDCVEINKQPFLAGQIEDALSMGTGEHGWSMFRYFVECNFLKTKRNISPMFSGPLRWQAVLWVRYKPGGLRLQSEYLLNGNLLSETI